MKRKNKALKKQLKKTNELNEDMKIVLRDLLYRMARLEGLTGNSTFSTSSLFQPDAIAPPQPEQGKLL
jgi:hypothetical protein